MAEPTTPTGLTAAEAEALSAQQKPNYTYAPQEGAEYFQYGGDIYVIKGGKVYNLDFNNEDFAPGGTGSDKRAAANSWASGVLGKVPEKNLAFVIEDLSRAQGVHGQQVVGGHLQKDNFFKVTQGADPNQYATATSTGAGAGYEVGGDKYALAKDIVYPDNPPGQQTAGYTDQSATPVNPVGELLGTRVSNQGLAPEDSLAGVRSVFGQDWQPAPAFTPEMQRQGIYGAVRVAGTPNVFTIGPGGKPLSAREYEELFGTSEQAGIVGEITREQAIKLGIQPASIDAPPVSGISSESLKEQAGINIQEDLGQKKQNVNLNPDVVQANLETYLNLQKTFKSEEQKQLEQDRADLKSQINTIFGELGQEGEMQLAEEEKRNVEALQQAVNDADAELELKIGEINALDASFNKKLEIISGKPITMSSIQGQQAHEYRMYQADKNVLLAEASLLQAKSLAAQKKLESAQNAANRAVDLKYNDLKTQLSVLMAQLEMADVEWSREEQMRVDALNRYYTELDREINRQMEMEKMQYASMLDLMSKYPDAGISFSDSLATAQSKLKNSRIYQEQVRPPQGPSLSTSLIDVNGVPTLINSRTGEVIKQYGSGQTFEDYLQEQQNLAGQTFSPDTREKLRQQWQASQTPTDVSPYQQERNIRTIQNIDDLMGDVNGWTVGVGSSMSFLPGTPARDFQAKLDTLKSNIAFGELTAMREASKTGGALGQVSDREGKLLESALGALDQGQSPEQFKEQLTKIKESILRWQEAQGIYSDNNSPMGTTTLDFDYDDYLKIIGE